MRRAFVLAAILAAFAFSAAVPGCGGGGEEPKKDDKDGKGKKGKKGDGKTAGVDDPTGQPNLSDEDKTLVNKLGALDEKHYKPAMERLRGMQSKAIGPLCWGLKHPLQNLRAKCLEVISELKPAKEMIPGAINAIGQSESDVSPYETPIRRWAMRLLARYYRYGVYTEPPIRRSIELDGDPCVRATAGFALCLMGRKEGMGSIIDELRPIDWETIKKMVDTYNDVTNEDKMRIEAMNDLEVMVKKSRLKASPSVMLDTLAEYRKSYEEAEAMVRDYLGKLGAPGDKGYDGLKSWWKGAQGSFEFKKVGFSDDPEMIKVGVKQRSAGKVELMPVEEENIVKDLTEAQELLAQGDKRGASGVLRRAFKESRNTRMDIYYDHFNLRRTLGPDHADKCYGEIRDKVIAWDPLNVKFRLLAAQCAIDFKGWKEAKEMYEIVLILEPDNAEAQAGIAEAKKNLKE